MPEATMVSLSLPPMMATTTLAVIVLTLALALPWTRIGWQGGGRTVTLVIATVIVFGTIFVSTHGTMAPRTTAAATDKAIMPISAAGKR
jgi:hypothetical protein